MQWIEFPDGPMTCHGLHWLDENLPELCRMPSRLAEALPTGVATQMRYPSGAALRLTSDTSELRLRLGPTSEATPAGFDVYVDGRYWRCASGVADAEGEVVCFCGAGRGMKEITVYLPVRQRVSIAAYGMDDDAACGDPAAFRCERPLVMYGSSVAQGVGAARPGATYAAFLSRSLGVDLINLGFGGAGKAEPEVVDLVTQVEACCYVLDLGKSYGRQSGEAYAAMLARLRADHPATPMVCVTPIHSNREFFSEEYVDLSEHARRVVREAVAERGDDGITLVEGTALLGPEDADGFCFDGTHPNDLGGRLIADRLRPTVERVLG